MTVLPLLSLAAGVLPEFPPDTIVRAAIDAGYPAAGIWVDADTWTERTTRAVKSLLDGSGIVALDAEVVWIEPGPTPNAAGLKLIEVAGELGARNVLIACTNPNLTEVKQQFAQLCERAEQAGARAVIEFMMIGPLNRLDAALEVVSDVAHPAGGILIDTLHLVRCGATPAEVSRIDPARLPYVQLCDGPAQVASATDAGYLEDALDARSAPGEGELPLDQIVGRLPRDVPMSLEVRSKRHRERYPDPVERARAILEATHHFFEQLEQEDP